MNERLAVSLDHNSEIIASFALKSVPALTSRRKRDRHKAEAEAAPAENLKTP